MQFSLLLSLQLLCVITPVIIAIDHSQHGLLMNTKAAGRHHQNEDEYCDKVISGLYCTDGTYQELANLYEKCGKPKDARVAQYYCYKNSMGEYCVTIDSSFPVATTCKGSEIVCTQECKTLLLSIRDRLGCCIPSFFNSSFITSKDIAYSYALWSSCGIKPVTQKCPPTPIVIHPTPVDPTCTGPVMQERVQSIECRREYVEGIRRKLAVTKGCENYGYLDSGECNANANGAYCKALPSMDHLFKEASNNCHETSTCGSLCMRTLNDITNTVGCCFMDQYNSTSHATEKWLSYEFWSKCQLHSPGKCKEFLNNGPPTV